MLGQLHDLALGPVTPAVGWIFAALGSLLGIILAAHARGSTGGRRVRLLACATVSVAVPGIWLPGLLAMVTMRVDGSVVRLDPDWLAMSLGAAFLGAAGALLLLGYGHRGADRMITGAFLLICGVAGGAHLMQRCLATGGRITPDLTFTGAALGTAAAASCVLALLLGAARSLRQAVIASVPVGAALAAVHVIAAAGLTVRPGPEGTIPADDVVGLAPLRVGLLGVLAGGMLLAMMFYFTVGTATKRDLRLVFEPQADSDQIEPWMIEQVRSRVALSSTAAAPGPGWRGDVWAERTVAVHSLPLRSAAAVSAFARGVREYRSEYGRLELVAADTAAPVENPEPVTGAGVQADSPEPVTGAGPTWRPAPGWGAPDAARSVLEPTPPPLPVYITRSGTRWDQRDWDHRDAPERNEPRLAQRTRADNNRQGQLPRRSPAANGMSVANGPSSASLVAVGGDEGPDPVDAPPLPRRNARP